MEMNEKIALLKERFIHRSDVYAVQWYREGKGTGYAKQTVGENNKPLTDATIQLHVEQKITLGVYNLDTNNTVKWLCFDVDMKRGTNLDSEEATTLVRQQTLALARLLLSNKLPFLVEQSGSKGYHLWVFFSEPVQALHAYALGRWASHQVPSHVDITIEIFPKQVMNAGYGNLVKMPLSIHQKTKEPCAFVGADWTIKKDQWQTLRNVRTMTGKTVEQFIEEKNISLVDYSFVPQSQGEAGKTTPTCIARMLSEGLKEGCLDVGLFKLGCYMRDRGMPIDMADASLTVMLNKMDNTPVWAGDLMEQKLASAYSKNYSPLPCSIPELDQFCSSSCRFFSAKVNNRFGNERQNAIGVISRD